MMHEISAGFAKSNRSAFDNFLLAKYEMYTGAVDVVSYPHFIEIEASDVCQLRCPTCTTGIENELKRRKDGLEVIYRRDRTKMTPTLLEAVLEEMGEYVFHVMFYNSGEPLLNNNLSQLIRQAKAYDIETDINTNLSVKLTDERINDLLESGLDYISASIDGFSQESYEVHRVGGNVELIKQNLRRLVKAKEQLGAATRITYNMLIFSHNEHEIGEAAKFCADLGIHFNPRPAFIQDPEWLPSDRKGQTPMVIPDEIALPEGFAGRQDDKNVVWLPFADPSMSMLLDPKPAGRCGWHYNFSIISAGGAVVPCCQVQEEAEDFGVVAPGQTKFSDVWNNDRVRKARSAFAGRRLPELDKVDTICARCPIPPYMYQLFSMQDWKVSMRLGTVLRGSDPILDKAFDLISRCRYGVAPEALEQHLAKPGAILGTGDPTVVSDFVEYFETNFLPAGDLEPLA